MSKPWCYRACKNSLNIWSLEIACQYKAYYKHLSLKSYKVY